MYFNYIVVLLLCVTLSSCTTSLDRALKSQDKELMIKTAQEQYDKGNFDEAILIYDKVTSYLTDVEETKDITYKTAQANMGAENLVTASHQFSVFNVNYPTSPLAEEALYLSAVCLYNLSPEYNLDSGYTQDAISKFQTFLNTYPDSKRLDDSNKKMEKLRGQLEKKAYEIAMLYFNITNYKAASVDLKNFLDDYPDTKLKENVLYHIFLSDYNLAIKSIKEKKEERIKDALNSHKRFSIAYTQSAYIGELDKLKVKLIEEQKQITTL